MSASLDLLPGDVGTYDIFNLIHSFSLLCSYKEKVGSLRRELQGAKSLAENFKVTNALLIPELFCTIDTKRIECFLSSKSLSMPALFRQDYSRFVSVSVCLYFFIFISCHIEINLQ